MASRPDLQTLLGKDPQEVPMSLQRILQAGGSTDPVWIGPNDAVVLTEQELNAYTHAHAIMCHMAARGPAAHASGHPGGPLSAFTFSYFLSVLRDPQIDQPLRMSAGHLSILAYTLQWLFGREGSDSRLASPQAIIDAFRTAKGLPGHAEAGIGDIPFGAGPLGKGVSNGLGAAFGLKHQRISGVVDVLLADGDAQEGQVMEAVRLAAHLGIDNLVVHGDWNDVQLSGLPTQVVAADFAQIVAAAGWQVIEVQNGNNPAQVKAAIKKADTLIGKGRPIFICYYTTMGHGISFMEEGSNSGKKNYHGAPLSDEELKEALRELPNFEEAIAKYEPFRAAEKKRYESALPVQTNLPLTFTPAPDRIVTTKKGAARKDFGAVHLLNQMKHDDRIVVLHADLAGSGGFTEVEQELPHRVINVGVAEANMAMMAAGIRQVGLLPITYTFAAFATNEARANARLIDINCGHTRCAVLHDCTHAGVSVGEDGETHQERHYLNIPFDHTQVWVPGDSNQAAAMAEAGLKLIAEGHTNVFVFSSRTGHEQLLNKEGNPIYDDNYTFDGKATLLRGAGDSSDELTIISCGIILHEALKATKELEQSGTRVRLLNIACVRPIDRDAVICAAKDTGKILVAEDHSSESGLAMQVAGVLADEHLPCAFKRLGVNRYFPSAPAKELYVLAGIDAVAIIGAAKVL